MMSIKKITDSDSVSDIQEKELIKCKLDINYFSENYVFVHNVDKGSILFEARDYQRELIELYDNNRFSIVVAPRQSGKSISTVVYLLYQTIFFKDVHIGIAANKADQAKELLARFKYSYECLPIWMKPAVKSYNVFSVEFNNNSSIEAAATSGSTFRGKSKNIIYLDEFAHVKPSIVEEFWTSLLPVISSGGSDSKTRIIISSTPNGSEGIFAELYHKSILDENGFANMFVDSERIPGRDEKFEKDMIEKMGYEKYLQEFKCVFISSKGTLINAIKLETLKPSKEIETVNNLRLFKNVKGKKLAVSADVGTGIGKDYSAIQIFDLENLEQVGEYRNNTINTLEFSKEFIRILGYLLKQNSKEVYYSFENNSIGNTVMSILNASEHAIFSDERLTQIDENYKTQGLTTTSKSKIAGCMTFKYLIENDKMKLNSKYLISELKFFTKQGQTFKAEHSMTDDLVMSCVILCNMLKKIAYFEDNIYNKINDTNIMIDDDDDYSPLPFIVDEELDDSFDDDDDLAFV